MVLGLWFEQGSDTAPGLMDGRKIAASREQQRKDRDQEELENGYSGAAADYDDDEMDMQ
jgi:GINS complex subunit 2